MENMLTVQQAADIMGVKPITIRRLIWSGCLPCARFSKGLIRIKPSDIESLIARGLEVNESELQGKTNNPTSTTTETTDAGIAESSTTTENAGITT